MQILICCATPGELKTVKTQIKNLHLKQKLAIDYLCTGIGNYHTIFSLTKFLTEHPDSDFFIVNIGICGYALQGILKDQLIQVGRIKNFSTEKELLPPLPFVFAKLETLWSSETVVFDRKKQEDGFVDMESWGIEFVADMFKTPRIFLKVPFDRIGIETQQFDKQKACRTLAEAIDYKKLIEIIFAHGTF